MWERSPALEDIIANSWTSKGTKRNLADVREALASVMNDLHVWSNKTFGNVTRELEKSRSRLEELTHMNADRREIKAEMDKMNELLYREEMLWLQRSRIQWLKEGDRNTQMFHRKAVWRARKNRIKSLTDEQGVVHTKQHMMLQLGNTYF